jgi:endonuclease YncB( thermonuclease family)
LRAHRDFRLNQLHEDILTMMRLRDITVAFILITGLAVISLWFSQHNRRHHAGFAYVIDGDTIRIEGDAIRLKGIDAPERHQLCGSYDRLYPCGEEARRALKNLLQGQIVDCLSSSRDRYHRFIAECKISGQDIAADIVLQGWALSTGDYAKQQSLASSEHRGIWQDTFETPASWRKAHPYDRH